MAVHVGHQGARRVASGARQRFVAAPAQLDNGTPVLSVMGDVDLATAPALEEMLFDLAETAEGDVIVDLGGCSFLDSAGLRALIAASSRLEQSDRSLALVLSNPSVMRIFQITQYDRWFEIYPSLQTVRKGNGHG
jgi:anti-sigma B factor antagonist